MKLWAELLKSAFDGLFISCQSCCQVLATFFLLFSSEQYPVCSEICSVAKFSWCFLEYFFFVLIVYDKIHLRYNFSKIF